MQNYMAPITLLIADDHALLREAWTFLLNSDARFRVVAECADAESAIEQCKILRPQIVLLDINFPGMSGLDAVPLILQSSPESKIVGISIHNSPGIIRKMIKQGARGYVAKNSTKEEMIEAIISVNEGKNYLCQYMKEQISQKFTEGENLDEK